MRDSAVNGDAGHGLGALTRSDGWLARALRGIARLEYVASVPLDEAMRQTGQLCRPVVSAAPESVAAEAFRDIAAAMADWARQEAEAGGVEHFMQQLLHLSQRIPTTHPRI